MDAILMQQGPTEQVAGLSNRASSGQAKVQRVERIGSSFTDQFNQLATEHAQRSQKSQSLLSTDPIGWLRPHTEPQKRLESLQWQWAKFIQVSRTLFKL